MGIIQAQTSSRAVQQSTHRHIPRVHFQQHYTKHSFHFQQIFSVWSCFVYNVISLAQNKTCIASCYSDDDVQAELMSTKIYVLLLMIENFLPHCIQRSPLLHSYRYSAAYFEPIAILNHLSWKARERVLASKYIRKIQN